MQKLFKKLKKNGSDEMSKFEKNESKKVSKSIDSNLKIENIQDNKTMRVLLLGAGGCGKSTIMKQMEKMHGKDLDPAENHRVLSQLHINIIADICDLCGAYFSLKNAAMRGDDEAKKQFTENFGFQDKSLEKVANDLHLSSNFRDTEDVTFDEKMCEQLVALWETDTIKRVYEIRKLSHIMDNTPYLLENARRFSQPDCKVNFEDFIRIRERTTGVYEKQFELNKIQAGVLGYLNVIDVGGQRSERKKWMKLFSDISFVIYVMSLAGYNQVLYEDNQVNAWDETLQLFSDTCHNKAFEHTDFIVFFNKEDVFLERIKEVPFTVYCKDFDESKAHDSAEVLDWIRTSFRQRWNMGKSTSRSMYAHVTCATDSKKIELVIGVVQSQMITKSLNAIGM